MKLLPLLAVGVMATMTLSVEPQAQPAVANPWVERQASGLPMSHSGPVLLSRQQASELNVRARQARTLTAEMSELMTLLPDSAEQPPLMLSLPLPDGSHVVYALSYSAIAAPSLAQKYPQLRTFSGVQPGLPQNRGRFDLTPQGFHGMFVHNGRTVMIDPQLRGNQHHYLSYYRDRALPLTANVLDRVTRPRPWQLPKPFDITLANRQQATSTDPVNLRSYRLAIATAAEYTQFHGGSRAQGMAALVTLVNRLNQIYETELAVRLELVADNDELIFTDPLSDPFNNDDEDSELNPGVIDAAIGNDNYDIGHVLGTGGGGLAGLGVVCDDQYKAVGVTGSDRPTGDSFYIDYVAHEIGHQFGAEHSFNGTAESCGGGNRIALSAYEPGSGSTIMSYASICGEQNLQDESDAYFHAGSIDEIQQNLSAGLASRCGSLIPLDNRAPEVNAGADYTIPAATPFVLTGSAFDPQGDTLSYGWEQYDLGSPSRSRATMVDDGTRPLFRSWPPVSDNRRYFPRREDVLADTLVIGETYPGTSRELNFRLTVRDGQGGVSSDDMKVTVAASDEAFTVLEPVAGAHWQSGEPVPVRWLVAGTDQPPINCHEVDISLSTDGGQHFESLLVTANSGEAVLNVPATPGDKARLQVSCVGNIFYAVNGGAFSIGLASTIIEPRITGQQVVTLNEDDSTDITVSQLQIDDPDRRLQGELQISLEGGEHYTVEGHRLLPAANFAGNLSVPLTVTDSRGVVMAFELRVTVVPVNDLPVTVDDNLSIPQDSGRSLVAVLNNDFDVESGEQLLLSGVDYQGNGQVSIENNSISYTPASGFVGTEAVQYQVSDTAGGLATGTLRVTVTATSTTSDRESSGGASFGLSVLLGVLMMRLARRYRRYW